MGCSATPNSTPVAYRGLSNSRTTSPLWPTRGFTNVAVQKQKPITLPEDLLKNYLTPDEIASYQQDGHGIFSITVFATKFATKLVTAPKA